MLIRLYVEIEHTLVKVSRYYKSVDGAKKYLKRYFPSNKALGMDLSSGHEVPVLTNNMDSIDHLINREAA